MRPFIARNNNHLRINCNKKKLFIAASSFYKNSQANAAPLSYFDKVTHLHHRPLECLEYSVAMIRVVRATRARGTFSLADANCLTKTIERKLPSHGTSRLFRHNTRGYVMPRKKS